MKNFEKTWGKKLIWTALLALALPRASTADMSAWKKIKAHQAELGAAEFWHEYKTEEGATYYFNSHTQETTWTPPAAYMLQQKMHNANGASGGASESSETEVHNVHGDLRPLRVFRDKKHYTNLGTDHLRVGKMFLNERVLFR